ncbi:hypothetical protein Pyn_00642 [Prunus yedoensis var. nudiflora]|uniref:Uncharacterized protein n=1 Tax=Prunus yedoensis var. nudiflora TaxID=2094558 RepID=A0A314Z4H7_PRUYE|nr:hypothetical protein Pyn_00642 [Prunus yedoensis var. nudiflora]
MARVQQGLSKEREGFGGLVREWFGFGTSCLGLRQTLGLGCVGLGHGGLGPLDIDIIWSWALEEREGTFSKGLGVSGLGTCCAVQQGAMWAWVEPRVLRYRRELATKTQVVLQVLSLLCKDTEGHEGPGVLKAWGFRRRHKACVLQGNVLRHEVPKVSLGTGVPKVSLGTGVLKALRCRRRHKACMLQGNELRHGVPKVSLGSTKLACCKTMSLGTGVPKVSLGKGVPKVKGCQRRHRAYMLQDNVFRHGDAEGELRQMGAECELRQRGAEGEWMPKATQSLHVARQCA